MQTVHQGSRHVESSIRNALKRTPFLALGQIQGICEVRSQRHCQRVCMSVCVRVSRVFHHSPSHVSTNLHRNVHKLLSERPSEKLWSKAISAWSDSLAALVCHAPPRNCFNTVNSYLCCCWDQIHISCMLITCSKGTRACRRDTTVPDAFTPPAGHNPLLCPPGP